MKFKIIEVPGEGYIAMVSVYGDDDWRGIGEDIYCWLSPDIIDDYCIAPNIEEAKRRIERLKINKGLGNEVYSEEAPDHFRDVFFRYLIVFVIGFAFGAGFVGWLVGLGRAAMGQ